MKEQSNKIRCGGSVCELCKKIITPPRLRKIFIPIWYTTCEECEIDVLTVSYRPREDAIMTDFKIKFQDIDGLISTLLHAKGEQGRKE